MAESSDDDQAAENSKVESKRRSSAAKKPSLSAENGDDVKAESTPKKPRKRTPKPDAPSTATTEPKAKPKAARKPKPATASPDEPKPKPGARKAAQPPPPAATDDQPTAATPASVEPVVAAPEPKTEPAANPPVSRPANGANRLYVGAFALTTFSLGLALGVVLGAVMAGGREASPATETQPALIEPGRQPNVGEGQPSPTAEPPESLPDAAPIAANSPGVITQLNGGPGPMQSGTFTLPGGPTKVRYQSDGANTTVRLLQQGGSGGDSFYCPGPCSREASLDKTAGDYYLNVDAKEGNWTVEVATGQ